MSKKKNKKRKPKKPRSIEALTAILHCKSVKFKDKRAPRKGSKNKQKEYMDENY